MTRTVFFIAFASFIAYGAWNGCADSMQNQRAANIEHLSALDAI